VINDDDEQGLIAYDSDGIKTFCDRTKSKLSSNSGDAPGMDKVLNEYLPELQQWLIESI